MPYHYIKVDLADAKSIAKAEKKKAEYENKGYTLAHEFVTPFRATLTYREDVKP